MKKNKKKIYIVIGIIVLLIIAFGIYRKMTKKYDSIEDFTDVREVCSYYKCDFISITKSENKDFEKDVKIHFGIPPIDEIYVKSNQEKYETIISAIDKKIGDKNIRIIDESRNLIIEVKYNKEKSVVEYVINNDENFFKTQLSKASVGKKKTIKELLEENKTRTIKSYHLQKIVNGKWNESVELGNKYKFDSRRIIYWDEAIETNIAASKIINVKFTTRYKDEIIEDIKTGMNNNEIISILGEPDFKENSENKGVIGYVIDKMYFYFINGEIYVYNVEENNETKDEQFINAIDKMNKDGDYNAFIDTLTSIYPDYTTYNSGDSFVNIEYPHKGISFSIGNNQHNGITLYSNYQGKLSIDDKKANVLFRFDCNRIEEDIIQKDATEKILRDPYYGGENEYASEIYNVIIQSESVDFYSIDKTERDFKLNKKINDIKPIDNYSFVYSINNDGIYTINVITGKEIKIYETTDEIKLENIADNKIYFNNGLSVGIK